jgi:hypothetical protein
MKPKNGTPGYLVRNPFSYCFRIKVPKDLQKFVGRKELRYTLKMSCVGVAKQKARFVAGQVQLIFKFLRKGGAFWQNFRRKQYRNWFISTSKMRSKAGIKASMRMLIRLLSMMPVNFAVTLVTINGIKPSIPIFFGFPSLDCTPAQEKIILK